LKAAEDFLDLPYHFCPIPSEDYEGNKGWFVQVLELEGCMSQGKTPDEAMIKIRDAMLGWIDVTLKDGQDVPLPFREDYDHINVMISLPVPVIRPLQRRARREKRDVYEVAADVIASAVADETAMATASS
jgi:antitoxin HicB